MCIRDSFKGSNVALGVEEPVEQGAVFLADGAQKLLVRMLEVLSRLAVLGRPGRVAPIKAVEVQVFQHFLHCFHLKLVEHNVRI